MTNIISSANTTSNILTFWHKINNL